MASRRGTWRGVASGEYIATVAGLLDVHPVINAVGDASAGGASRSSGCAFSGGGEAASPCLREAAGILALQAIGETIATKGTGGKRAGSGQVAVGGSVFPLGV